MILKSGRRASQSSDLIITLFQLAEQTRLNDHEGVRFRFPRYPGPLPIRPVPRYPGPVPRYPGPPPPPVQPVPRSGPTRSGTPPGAGFRFPRLHVAAEPVPVDWTGYERERKVFESRCRQETLRHYIAAHQAAQRRYLREQRELEQTAPTVIQQLREAERKYSFEKEMEQIAERQLSRELLYMSDPERSGHAGGAGPLPLHLLFTDLGEPAGQEPQRGLEVRRVHETVFSGIGPHRNRRPPIHYRGVDGTVDHEHGGERHPPSNPRQGTGKGHGPQGLGPSGRKQRPGGRRYGGGGDDFRANNEGLLNILERPSVAERCPGWQGLSEVIRKQLATTTTAGQTNATPRPRDGALMGLAVAASAELFDLNCQPTATTSKQLRASRAHDSNEAGPDATVLPPMPRLTALPGSGRPEKSHMLTKGFHQTPNPPECPDEIDVEEPELIVCTPDQAGLSVSADQADRPTSSPDSTAPLRTSEENVVCEDGRGQNSQE